MASIETVDKSNRETNWSSTGECSTCHNNLLPHPGEDVARTTQLKPIYFTCVTDRAACKPTLSILRAGWLRMWILFMSVSAKTLSYPLHTHARKLNVSSPKSRIFWCLQGYLQGKLKIYLFALRENRLNAVVKTIPPSLLACCFCHQMDKNHFLKRVGDNGFGIYDDHWHQTWEWVIHIDISYWGVSALT